MNAISETIEAVKGYISGCYVYKFELTFYEEYNEVTNECKHHHHSGLIIARSTKDAYNKLFNDFSDYNSKDFDFESISIKEYNNIYSSMIIFDKEDELG